MTRWVKHSARFSGWLPETRRWGVNEGEDGTGHGSWRPSRHAAGRPQWTSKEVRGWIALHCAGLTEEQKAIVIAKTQRSLDLETISAGIRSCFPSLRASTSKARKPIPPS